MSLLKAIIIQAQGETSMRNLHHSARPANPRHHHDRWAQPRRDILRPEHAAGPAAPPHDQLAGMPLSSELWVQLCAIESEAEALDRALRRAWYLVGGVVLPCLGMLVYAQAFVR